MEETIIDGKIITLLVILGIVFVVVIIDRISAKNRNNIEDEPISAFERASQRLRENVKESEELEELKNQNKKTKILSQINDSKIQNLIQPSKTPEQIADELAMVEYLRNKGKL